MSRNIWWDYADYHFEPDLDYEEREYVSAERTCVARVMRGDHSGENRFYVVVATDGSWFAWGEWHGRIEIADNSRATAVSEEADDATYTFADGGAYFPSREVAMVAIYRWIQRDLKLELEDIEVKNRV